MSKILTVTLNPSLDRTLFVHHLAEGYPNIVTEQTRLDPAGHGVNISRALHEMDTETHAMLLLGTDAIGSAYRALIEEEAFPTTLVRRQGLTRSNTIIFDSGKNQETKIIEEGDNFSQDQDDVELIVERLLELVQAGDTVCLSGTLPLGLPVDLYGTIIGQVRATGGKAVLAAGGIGLEIGLKANPDIIFSRSRQLESFFNYPVRSAQDVIYSARKLSERSSGSMILISDEELQFGVIVNANGGWTADMPSMEEEDSEGTTSGIHDAFLGGFLSHYRDHSDMPTALKWAIAAATYTRQRPGNEFGKPEQVRELAEQVTLSEV